MWPNPQESADLVNLLKKYLTENFIFCAVYKAGKTPYWDTFYAMYFFPVSLFSLSIEALFNTNSNNFKSEVRNPSVSIKWFYWFLKVNLHWYSFITSLVFWEFDSF